MASFLLHFKKHLLIYVPILLIGATIPFCFFDSTYDFGLNILAEMIGVAVTVYLVDKIYKLQERKKRFPIDKRIFADLQMIITSYLLIWKQLIVEYSNDKQINTIEDIIAIQNEVLEKANLNDEFKSVNVQIPKNLPKLKSHKSVLEAFQEYQGFINQEIPKFITEYKFYMDPDLYDLLSQLLESDYNQSITNFKNMERANNIISLIQEDQKKPLDSNALIDYINENSTEHFLLIQQLIEYSTKLYNEIKNLGEIKEDLYDLKSHFENSK